MWKIKIKRGNKILLYPQKQNAYSFVHNNPLAYTDPNGEEAIWLTLTPADVVKVWAIAVEAEGLTLAWGINTTIDEFYWEPKYEETLNSDNTTSSTTRKESTRSSNWDIGDIVDTPETNPDGFIRGKTDNFPNGGKTWTDESWNIWSRDRAGDKSHWGSYWKVYDKGTKKPSWDKRKTINKDWKVLRN